MKTNMIHSNSIKTYICAVVLMLGMSVSAWGTTLHYGAGGSSTMSYTSPTALPGFDDVGSWESTDTWITYEITSAGSYDYAYGTYYGKNHTSYADVTDLYALYQKGGDFITRPVACTDPELTIDPDEKEGNYGTLTSFDIDVVSYSSGTITWTSTNTDVATVSGDGDGATVTIVSAGLADIVCTQAANGSYCAGEKTCTLLVNAVAPKVSSNATGKELTVSSITSTGATFSGGVVTNRGGEATLQSYGYIVGTSSSVTYATRVTQAGTNADIALNTAFGSKSVTGLSPNTTYYVRPIANNTEDIGYGTAVSFTTLAEYSIDLLKNNSDVGSEDGVAYVEENGTAFLESEAPTRTGYDVEGYYTDAACTAENKVATSAGALRASISVNAVAWTNSSSQWIKGGTAEFYTKWTVHTHSLSWSSNGGDALTGDYTSGASIAYGTTIVKPNTPTRSGYVFDGWAESAGGSVVDVPATMPDADKTYYAKWRAATYINYTFACAELELEEPDNDADNVLRDTVYITSTSGQKVRSLATFHVRGTGLTASKEVKFTTGNGDLDAIFSFKDGNGNAISTDASGAVDADVYIFYQPTETSDGRDIITAVGGIRAYVERNANGGKPRSVKNTARTINGRHLPSQFIIAAKSGGVWYALPSDASVTGAQMGYTFTPDNTTTPTKATVAPQTALYTIYAPTADATYPSYVRIASTNSNKTLWSNSSTTYGIKDNALIGGGSAKGKNYEWRLENTGADSYKLYNNASYGDAGRYLGIKGTKWNVFSAAGDVVQDLKILPVDAVSDYIRLSATDWEETAFGFNITSGTPPTAPSLDHIQIGYNGKNYEASISGSKLTITDAAFVTDGGFGAASGSQLLVEWCNSSNAVLAQGSVLSPIIISSNTVNLSDYDTEALAGTDIFITNRAKLTISENTTVHDVTVNSGSTLFVNETAGGEGVTMTLSSGKLALKGGWNSDYSEYDMPRVYINPLSSLSKTYPNVNFDISVDSRNYYPFAVPFRVKVGDVNYVNPTLAGAAVYGTHYVIKEYDGAGRAENGVVDENWKVVPKKDPESDEDVYLEPGKGYILTAVSIPAYGGGVIRFPMSFANAWTTLGEQATVSDVTKNVLEVTHHEGAATAGGGAAKRHEGWNMLGVPFMSCYTSGTDMYDGVGSADLMTGRMTLSGDPSDPYGWETGDVVYVSVPTHDFSEYIQTDIMEAKLLPGWSFFIQVGETGNLTFLTTKQREDSDMPIYAPQRTMDSTMTRIKTGVILSSADGETSDKFGLIISDRYTQDYEVGADLEKMFGNGYTLATYSLSQGTRLAFNALSTAEAAQVIPVGYRAPEAGQYTFAINPRYATEGLLRVELIDYQTGDLTDLLTSTYTFTTSRTQDDTRFAIHVTYTDPNSEMPTGEAPPIETGETLTRKFILNGQLYIQRGTVIYDATGKEVRL